MDNGITYALLAIGAIFLVYFFTGKGGGCCGSGGKNKLYEESDNV